MGFMFLYAGLLADPSEEILTNQNGLIENNVIPGGTNVPSVFAKSISSSVETKCLRKVGIFYMQ